MGLLDIFKASENEELKNQINMLNDIITPEYKELINLDEEIINRKSEINNMEEKIKELIKEKEHLSRKIEMQKAMVVETKEEVMLQEFNLYKPSFEYLTSDEYKDALIMLLDEEKNMINNKTCITYFNDWIIKEDKEQKEKQMQNDIKQILMSFNIECERSIENIKFNNIEIMEKRIIKCFERLNKAFLDNKVSITQGYLDLKLEKLHLTYEYKLKKQKEKEEQKRIKDEVKDKTKFEKELKEEKKNCNKKLKELKKELANIEKEPLKENLQNELKKATINSKKDVVREIQEVEECINSIENREKKLKSGYIYVLSNIGSFGENVYKIGMTKRLNPNVAIEEFSDGAVPFGFDIHAMIFTENALVFKNQIFKELENKRVNKVNQNNTFFYGPLKHIEKVIKQYCGKDTNFIRISEAREFRESLREE